MQLYGTSYGFISHAVIALPNIIGELVRYTNIFHISAGIFRKKLGKYPAVTFSHKTIKYEYNIQLGIVGCFFISGQVFDFRSVPVNVP